LNLKHKSSNFRIISIYTEMLDETATSRRKTTPGTAESDTSLAGEKPEAVLNPISIIPVWFSHASKRQTRAFQAPGW
jgi:hypothetical protein